MAEGNYLIEYLKRMKSKLQSQEMSVMVGAGFSKNVNEDLYPSWWELLADMVKHMHGKKFEDEYAQIKPASKRPDHKIYIKNKIDLYINETGPLKVASKYMELHGYRESIDSYIESRTPYIVPKDDKKYLRHFAGGTVQDLLLSDDDLSAHQKLINLPWNNIYTTNYDNLLEKCIDENIEKEITKQIDTLKNVLAELEERDIANNKERDRLEREIDESQSKKVSDKIFLMGSDAMIESSKAAIDTKDSDAKHSDQVELRRLESEMEFLSRQIVIKEKELSRLRSLLKSCPSVIIRSSQLALKRTRNIIKLHGTRRTEENNIFGFDEDARKQYVITQEDFDSYPSKHEAFTQLMRISLLQESFCLVGFSGVDPNFLAWIGWVRDVLFKEKNKKDGDDEEKIYLISPSKFPAIGEADYGKSTFYENQRIANIPLLEDICLDFLEKEAGRTLADRSSRKDALSLLFDYLQSETFVPSPELAVEVSHRTKFNQLCENLPGLSTDLKSEIIDSVIAELSSLENLKVYNRFPSIIFSYDFKRQIFLDHTEVYLAHIKNDSKKLRVFLPAVSFFLKVQLYPQSIFYHEKPNVVKTLAKLAKGISPTLYGEFLLLSLKDAIWYDKEEDINKLEKKLLKIDEIYISQERQYLMALWALLRLKFDQLELYLNSWDAVDHWIVKKAGLLTHFDTNKAKSILLKNEVKIIQERLYELELYRYLEYSSSQSDSQNNDRYKYLKESGLHTIQNSADYLINEIKEKESKILPYGEEKNTIKNGTSLSNTDKDTQSMQFIGLMLDSGFPFSTYDSTFYSAQKIYQLLINTLKYRWLPAIQSALQFSDVKFIKRIAQDFIIISYDKAVYRKASDYLQTAYFNSKTPFRYKENIIVFLTEMINIVNPEKWNAFFIKVWTQNLDQIGERSHRRSAYNDYLYRALPLISMPSTIAAVVNDSLNINHNKNNFDTVVQYLYALASNPLIKNNNASIRPLIADGFMKVIRSLRESPENIFLLANTYTLLSDQDKNLIYDELESLDFKKVKNVRFWRVVLFFIKGNNEIVLKIKDSILKSDSLWNAGFTKKGVSRGDFIALHLLRTSENYDGIEWNTKEVMVVYNALLKVLKKINNFLAERSERDYFGDILEEMLTFLRDEKAILRDVSGYKEVLENVNATLNSQREFDDPLKGLISSEQNKILWALNEIVAGISDFENWTIGRVYMDTLANKILLQKLPTIEACLDVLSYLVTEFKEIDEFKTYRITLVAILTQYRDYPLIDADQAYIEERLVKIAVVLNDWGDQENIVEYYLDLLKTSRFNNVSYNLAGNLPNLQR